MTAKSPIRMDLSRVKPRCVSWFRLLSSVGVLFLAGFLSSTSNGQTQLVTYFNFNDSVSGVPNVVSDAPGTQTSTITTDFATPGTNFVTQTGTTVNRAPGDLSLETFALSLKAGAQTVNNGMSIQFSVSTVNLIDLSLSYATRRSTTGFVTQTLAYSVNGGTFVNFGTFNPVDSTTFTTASFNLSAIDAIENQASVTFRITFTGATNAGGTNGLDNIQLTGTPVPEPSTWVGGALALLAIGYTQRRRFVKKTALAPLA